MTVAEPRAPCECFFCGTLHSMEKTSRGRSCGVKVELRKEAPFAFFPLGWKPTVIWTTEPGNDVPDLGELAELSKPFVPMDCRGVRVHLYQGVAYLVGYYLGDSDDPEDAGQLGNMQLLR